MILKILLAGDGGQGIQSISDLLAQASFANGFFISQIPNYGLEQRGGVSLSFLIISDEEIAYPRFSEPNVLLIMSEQADARTKKFKNADLPTGRQDLKLDINDFVEVFKENNILKQSYNIFFLGLITKFLADKNILKTEQIFELLEKKLSKKTNWEENKKAFELSLKINK
ncbi:MAG: hypothetical protein US42_C0005G0008 [Candidatus Magasanikbacteria bacterium GW2011_GWC2_37_14]|uniref:Pyruvate/ketoisovalerate oxidoreductase catalytic domain-containing protein n=1 Tax=Candidatus Magasanikbacteria bacterium GW2011_GWC2_37_14 TaxID=1619046 RepID=A0A0G0G9L1_9BACT|nr:MAG: hypothetical protein US42_C0005G0008 [Candidatus Magasanikbacteria bacterium GW2011_GWC2_37_14]